MKAEAIKAPAATSEGNPNPPVASNKTPAMLGPTIWPRPNAAVILASTGRGSSGCNLARSGQPQRGQTHEGTSEQRRGEQDSGNGRPEHAGSNADCLSDAGQTEGT